MKLTFKISPEHSINTLVVKRDGDRKAKASGYTRNQHGWGEEIHLLHLMRVALNDAGFNVASVKVSADGHMMGDDYMRYLRTPKKELRKRNVDYPYLYIIDAAYAVRSSAERYNAGEAVVFEIHGNPFTGFSQPEWFMKVKALCEKGEFECELKIA